MDHLPDEIIWMILEMVPVGELIDSVSRVCRRWAAMVRQRVLLVRRPGDVRKLQASLRALQVYTHVHAPGALLADVLQLAPRLRYLTLHAATPLTSEHFGLLARLPCLVHLDVFATARVYDGRLAPAARRLRSFVVNESVAPGLLRAVATTSELQALYMYGRAMHYQSRELATLLHVRAAHLTELVLRCSELGEAAYQIIGGCANLTVLQLYSCWLMTGSAALHATRPRRLRTLHMTGARLVRSPGLSAMLEQLPRDLLELDLSCSWFGDEHIDLLVARLPALRVFEAWRSRLTRDGAITLGVNLPRLVTLDLDLMLFDRHFKVLDKHPSLKLLRCLLETEDDEEEDSEETELFDSEAPVTRLNNEKARAEQGPPTENVVEQYSFRIISTDAKYARRWFRGGNEGFRATLFYYWTRNRHLEPLPPHMQTDTLETEYAFVF